MSMHGNYENKCGYKINNFLLLLKKINSFILWSIGGFSSRKGQNITQDKTFRKQQIKF